MASRRGDCRHNDLLRCTLLDDVLFVPLQRQSIVTLSLVEVLWHIRRFATSRHVHMGGQSVDKQR